MNDNFNSGETLGEGSMASEDLSAAQRDPVQVSAEELCAVENCDVLVLNGPLFADAEDQVLRILKDRRLEARRPNRLVFVLTTPGGNPDVAYRIGRSIQNTYERSEALVGGWCKSAGTLLLVTANSLILSDDAELGPLDMQLARRDELNESDSGLVIDEALDNLEIYAFQFFDAFMRQIKEQSKGLVTLKTASEISSSIVKGLFEPIYRQIEPQKIGEVARSMAVGKNYGLRLNLRPRNLRPRALDTLLKAYPSHGFVIDRDEAKMLFKSVEQPTEQQSDLLLKLGSLASTPCKDPVVMLITKKDDDHENHTDATERAAAPALGQPSRRPAQSRRASDA